MLQVDFILLIKVFFAVFVDTLACTSGEFSCLNGECIEVNLWCDGEIDCRDQTDERFCRYSDDGTTNSDPNRCSNIDYFFLCLDGRCIPSTGKCDGYPSCSDGSDEKGCGQIETSALETFPVQYDLLNEIVDDSSDFEDLNYWKFSENLNKAREWLLSQRDQDFGWGEYTPRVVVALSLSKTDNHLKEEAGLLMEKQLHIQLSIALTRESLSLSEMALYINALMATCSNPRNFYGFDLITILRQRIDTRKRKDFISPFVFLTLCLNNKTTSEDFNVMQNLQGKAADKIDVLALGSLAFSCMMKTSNYPYPQYRRRILLTLLNKIESVGLPGNVYEMSLLVQALNEARVDHRKWKRQEAMDFILSNQNETGSFGDILATYYVIPLLSGKSMLSLDHCNHFSKDLIPLEVLKNAVTDKILVPYTLFFGFPIEMSQKIEIKVVKGTNFLDVMRLAQENNPNFRFKLDSSRDNPFVFSIGGIPNDAERGLYWSLYVPSRYNRSDYTRFNGDIRKHIPTHGEETVFWLRTI